MRGSVRWIFMAGGIFLAGWLVSRRCGVVELGTLPVARPARDTQTVAPPGGARRGWPGATAKVTDSEPEIARLEAAANQAWLEKLSEDPYASWKSPMSFYGLVWDEHQRPVAGVMVSFSWEEDDPENRVITNVLTGTDGRFELRGRRGALLTLALMCEGYYVSRSTPRVYDFNERSSVLHQPDPARPVVFFLRRHGYREALVEHRLGFELANGAAFGVDLTTGRRVERGGDLEVRFHRAPAGPAGYAAWSLELTAAGILESQEEFMFVAPTEGYGRSLLLRGAVDGDSPEISEARFFVKGPEGKFYGRAKVMLNPGGGAARAGLALYFFVNTNGSVNLEADPF